MSLGSILVVLYGVALGADFHGFSLDYSRTPQLLAVIPVATGIQVGQLLSRWIPAYAGMTEVQLAHELCRLGMGVDQR